MDYGFAPPGTTPASIKHSDRLQTLFSRRVPTTSVRRSGRTLESFVDDLETDASVNKPVDNLLFGAHASSEGYIFQPMFAGQTDFTDTPNDNTDYEVLDKTVALPRRPVDLDALVGVAAPPPTHFFHIKGCNVGRDRVDMARNPKAPFLARLKAALGGHVDVTAPKHFHGVYELDDGSGSFEYMAHEWVVRTKATKVEKDKKTTYRGFADRPAVIAAFETKRLRYYDGTLVPAAEWPKLVPKKVTKTVKYDVSLPLGRTVADQTTMQIGREFRVELAEVDWPVRPPGGIPASDAGKLAALRADLAADDRFKAAHAWPAYERVGFTSFADYFDGHLWSISSGKGGVMTCTGRRFDYTVLEPIVDRTVNPPGSRPVIFNFYPGGNTAQGPITTGFVETNTTYFGRA